MPRGVIVALMALVCGHLPVTAPPEAGEDYVAAALIPEHRVVALPGVFTSPCGRNMNGHRNSDNVINSPGVAGAASHLHDYVGNVATDAHATDASLAAAGTTCENGDRSTYYWPVLRDRGIVVQPESVQITFHADAATDVVAMPRFLRLVTGDAKAVTSGGRHARARWSCGGRPDSHTDRYPLCPPGEPVVRTFDYPSCWDGRRIDSPNHRDHVVFPAAQGGCPHATFPIPRLQLRVFYRLSFGTKYRIDTFPDQLNSPATDHGDFINVMPDDLMQHVVTCLNSRVSC